MPSPEWRCSACGCGPEAVERDRALAGLPGLADDALACGQRCALALVEREVAAVDGVVQAAAAAAGEERPAAERAPVPPRLAAYVHVISQMNAGR